tara:strand:- start:2370 stop:3161 length:792 start_codon:yes stop_codon:yes gene_type:complete
MRRIRRIKPGNAPQQANSHSQTRIQRGVRTNKIVKTNVPPVIKSNPVTVSNTHSSSIAKWNYDTVKPIWLDETVYLIGGGPSLKGFQWDALNGKKTIAINRAVQFYPNADAVYWTDSRVYMWYKKDIDKFKGLKYTLKAGNHYTGKVHVLKKGVKFGLESSRDSLAHGLNSGYAAINLAVHLGAKRIVLLGYDMGNEGALSHFHDGYPVNATAENIYRNQFIPGFTVLRELLYTKGIECYNASINSKLEVFPKIDLIRALSLS